MSKSVQSILSNILKSPSATSNNANNSWYLGSSSQPKVSSYITVAKPSSSGTIAKSVASHFGIDPKDPKDKKKKHHESLLGSILGGAHDVGENLVSDVINTAEGTPAGLLKLATTNPVDSAKMIGKDYATRYGKLFRGDFGGFASDVGKHPFGYLLDASSLGTGSGAVLGRLAPKLAEGGEVALRVDRAASKAGGVENTTRQLSRNVFTRNVFEKPAYSLQRTLPQSLPIFGERASAIRHITGQVEGKVGALGHANQVFEKTVRDVRHEARKDDTLTQAFDKVSADLRHRPLQTFGQGLHTPASRAFDPKRDTRISENATRHSDEITQLADNIKSEIKLDERGNLVAKDGASPATHSFLKVHNAREALNQSLVKTEELVGKVNPQAVAKKVASTGTPAWFKRMAGSQAAAKADMSTGKAGLGVHHVTPTTSEYVPKSFKSTPGTPGKETITHTPGNTFKAGGSAPIKKRIVNPEHKEAGQKILADGTRVSIPSSGGPKFIWVEEGGTPAQTFRTPGTTTSFRTQGTRGEYSSTPGHTVHTEGESKYYNRESNSPNKSRKVSSGSSGKLAQATAEKVAPKVASFLDGVRTVDTHSDPVSNYLEMHGKAIKSAGNAIAKGYLEKFGDNPKLAQEITGIFDKHSPAGSLAGQYNKATQIWKDLILVGRPAFLVNNFVGNQAMYHLKQGLGGMSFQKASRGELNKPFDTHFFEHRQSLGSSEKAAPRYNEHGTELEPSRYRRNANKVYNVQSKHEQILRKATMREAAMAIPAIKTEVRKLIGEKNLSEGEALSQAMTKAFKDNPGYREIIGKAIDDTMGNYRHYNRFEKGVKAFVPFYGWNRHALRTYTSMIKDQPSRTAAIAEVGLMGNRENASMFPDTPDFMKTYITGKLGTFDSAALNPLKGGSDTVRSIKELVAGNPGNMPAIASNLNPFISTGAQALSGVNLATGAPVKASGGLIGSVIGQTTGGLPQIKALGLAVGKDGGDRKDPHYFLTTTGQLKRKFKDSEGKVLFGPDGLPVEAGDRHMITPSLENSVLSWLGIPKRDVNLKTAQIVKKSIDSKLHPANEFHKRKATKKKTNHIVDLYKKS